MEVKNQLDEMDVALVMIGSGNIEEAQKFIEKFDLQGEMYLDPSLAVYKAFGLKRGFWKTLGPASLARGIRTMTKGFHQGRSAGDLWQQGGVFVIGPGNQLHFQHRNKSAGDQAKIKTVLEASSKP